MTTLLEAPLLSAPLTGAAYRRAQQAYVARSLAELLHERLLAAEAEAQADGTHLLRIATPDGGVVWTCRARRRGLDYWSVLPGSARRREGSVDAPGDDPARLYLDFAGAMGVEPFTLARYLEETAQTLYADACILARGRPTADALAVAPSHEVEAAMEGHPWVLVNKGRMGFGALEQQTLTPEAGAVLHLHWVAAARGVAEVYAIEGTSYDALLKEHLGEQPGEELERLRQGLRSRGLDPDAFHLVPLHPWQYAHKIVPLFAAELAEGRLVDLGPGRDGYRPQQSLRTFQHASHPERTYLKTALSILNTGQVRGLSPEKLRRAPRVTAWLKARLEGDGVFGPDATVLLGEVATLVYEHPAFRAVNGAPYPVKELLGALLRESALPALRPDERVVTMASLLYVDDDGRPLVAAFADRAGLSLLAWIEAYLTAYLTPLLQAFFRHETFFVAHGENTLLVLQGATPTRVVLKDFVEEVQVSARVRASLPEELAALFYDVADELLPLFLLTDVVDGFFRYLADVLATHGGVAEERFWALVARVIHRYEDAHPELAPRFAEAALFAPEFPRFCLNKYRLVLFGYQETAHNVLDTSPPFSGTLPNPLAPYRRSP